MITKTIDRPVKVIDLDKIKIGMKVNVKTRSVFDPQCPDLWYEDMDGEVTEVYEDYISVNCYGYSYDFNINDIDNDFCQITIIA